MKNIFQTIVAFCLMVQLSQAQVQELFSLQGRYQIQGIDVQGNVYVTRKNALLMYDKKGKQLHNFSDPSKGIISDVDVNNPMKIVVLFSDARQIVVLDNTLSPIGNIVALNELGIEDPVVACYGNDSGFWVYDRASGTFVFFNWLGYRISESTDVRYNFSGLFEPEDLTVLDDALCARDDSLIAVLDLAGNFQGTLFLPQKIFSCGQTGLFVLESDGIYSVLPVSSEEISIDLSIEQPTKFYFHFPYILTQYEKKITLFLLSPN